MRGGAASVAQFWRTSAYKQCPIAALSGDSNCALRRCMFRAVVQGAHLVRAGTPTTPAKETELADELRKRVC